MRIRVYMASCPARDQTRASTLANLKSTDWGEEPIVCLEDPVWDLPLQRHMALVRRMLEIARRGPDNDLLLLLEDDIVFNRHLRHNLDAWEPLRLYRAGDHFFASLFNPGVRLLKSERQRAFAAAAPDSVYGAQAVLLSPETAHFLATCWGVYPAMHADLKLANLAAMVCPILFHVPSLVQHIGLKSLWGGPFLSAADFDSGWRAHPLMESNRQY